MNYLMAISFSEILTNVGNWLVTEGLKIVIALIVFCIYCAVIKAICRRLDKSLVKKNVDETLRKVSLPWVKRVLIFIGFATMLAYLGIETSSIAAAITSIGLTIGLALQGSLSNFAGGVVVIVMRPYKIGDYIEMDSEAGTVVDIKLFYTYLRTGDNKIVVIPNSKAGNSVIINYTRQGTRRDDITFNISYDNDFEKAKEAIRECIESCDKILKDPAPLVTLSNHGQNSLDILARYYTKTDDYWDVHWYMMEAVKKAFDKYGISIPYPQLDVHIANNDTASSKNK